MSAMGPHQSTQVGPAVRLRSPDRQRYVADNEQPLLMDALSTRLDSIADQATHTCAHTQGRVDAADAPLLRKAPWPAAAPGAAWKEAVLLLLLRG